MNPLVTKRAIVSAAVLTLLAVALAVGLFITVRNYDRPSDAELVEISESLQYFFRTYDMQWPESHYEDDTLDPSVTEAMQRDAQNTLMLSVSDDHFAEELASEQIQSLQQARSDRGVIVTQAGHRVVNVRYLRTTVERSVIVRVDTIEWRQEAQWDPYTDGLTESKRAEEQESYELTLHRQNQRWRVVGMRPAE